MPKITREGLVDLLATALPYIEDATESPLFKKGVVKKHAAAIRAAIEAESIVAATGTQRSQTENVGHNVSEEGHSVSEHRRIRQSIASLRTILMNEPKKRFTNAEALAFVGALTAIEKEADELLSAAKVVAPWMRGGDYDTRGGLIEMSRLASVLEAAIAAAEGRANG